MQLDTERERERERENRFVYKPPKPRAFIIYIGGERETGKTTGEETILLREGTPAFRHREPSAMAESSDSISVDMETIYLGGKVRYIYIYTRTHIYASTFMRIYNCDLHVSS